MSIDACASASNRSSRSSSCCVGENSRCLRIDAEDKQATAALHTPIQWACVHTILMNTHQLTRKNHLHKLSTRCSGSGEGGPTAPVFLLSRTVLMRAARCNRSVQLDTLALSGIKSYSACERECTGTNKQAAWAAGRMDREVLGRGVCVHRER